MRSDAALNFFSDYTKKTKVEFPLFTGTRVLMMPVIMGDLDSIPDSLAHYRPMLSQLFEMQDHDGDVGYLTIDEKKVFAGKTQRRKGMHIDGMEPGNFPHLFKRDDGIGATGSWGGGGSGGSWGGGVINPNPSPSFPSPGPSKNGMRAASPYTSGFGNGMLLVSSQPGCRAWKQWFSGIPGIDGECDHFEQQTEQGTSEILEPNLVYWLDPFCVHESLPQSQDIDRQLVRLSLPSNCGWSASCTPNPLGIPPAGEILPYRTKFMVDANLQ